MANNTLNYSNHKNEYILTLEFEQDEIQEKYNSIISFEKNRFDRDILINGMKDEVVPKVDAEGNPIQKTDSSGKPVVDENGQPVYETELKQESARTDYEKKKLQWAEDNYDTNSSDLAMNTYNIKNFVDEIKMELCSYGTWNYRESKQENNDVEGRTYYYNYIFIFKDLFAVITAMNYIHKIYPNFLDNIKNCYVEWVRSDTSRIVVLDMMHCHPDYFAKAHTPIETTVVPK